MTKLLTFRVAASEYVRLKRGKDTRDHWVEMVMEDSTASLAKTVWTPPSHLGTRRLTEAERVVLCQQRAAQLQAALDALL